MAIKHERVVSSGTQGDHEDWNANHVVDDNSKPKNFTTLIVAASNSLDPTRADYVCDGIDDHLTVKEAVDALPAGGGRISLLEGTFQYAGHVFMNKANVSIYGLGRATIIQASTNNSLFNVAAGSGFVLESVHLVGTDNAAHTANTGVSLAVQSRAIIRNCWIEKMGGSGIYSAPGQHDIIIANNHCYENHWHGIQIQGNECTVVGNVCNDNGQNGIYALTGENTTITGNICDGNGFAGIRLSTDCSHVVIGNNVCSNAGSDGINLVLRVDECMIIGNICHNCGARGIEIQTADCDENVVVGNQIDGGLQDGGTNTLAANNNTI